MNKKSVSLRGFYHINIDVKSGYFFGNYSQNDEQCYLVFVGKGKEGVHNMLISVLEAYGEIQGELYDGYDHEIVRQILQLGHLTNDLKAKLPADVVEFFNELCN